MVARDINRPVVRRPSLNIENASVCGRGAAGDAAGMPDAHVRIEKGCVSCVKMPYLSSP